LYLEESFSFHVIEPDAAVVLRPARIVRKRTASSG
jgi:hypothetical protein